MIYDARYHAFQILKTVDIVLGPTYDKGFWLIGFSNKKSIIVRVNDRGPFAKNKRRRIIDLSEKAAELIGMKKKGIARVSVKLLPGATAILHKKLNLVKSHYKQHLIP